MNKNLLDLSRLADVPTPWDDSFYGPFPVLQPGALTPGFESPSKYCQGENLLGSLKAPDLSRLSWTPRRRFFPGTSKDVRKDHLAKTPYHAIRWAIHHLTPPGGFVLDPFMGSGTTAVEALIQGREVWGAELEFAELTQKNISGFAKGQDGWELFAGDAEVGLDQVADNSADLVNFSNPYPEGRDHNCRRVGDDVVQYRYSRKDNAGLMSGVKYWDKMRAIQVKACEKLKPGGYAIFVIKDCMKDRKVFPLHEDLADLLPDYMEFVGTVLLEHYPPTLFISTYEKLWGARPPKEQTCPIFRKRG